ncbi:hypothetical protein GYMLUDRAFT_40883 [Collybiopsis luxurians FD-317 M1]|uniref:Zn(2)-C6 fungal-type domain-containing protein n=1 Tax=Collybiopsis luxurians FD-317 M1 TaxID=944289 RepID=A0A0D0CLE6_9AGAR|nr:hypothetical protein GYMLUDRAFT_40883 [Collybiopsis luxurians FD-317 M1]
MDHHPLINTRPHITYSSMPMHMYPLTPNSQRSLRTKRRQVKNACTNCQRACKKCDDARPCLRCIKYGIPSSECVNSTRKERKKGVKRGPYKKRDCKGRASTNSADQIDDPVEYEQVSSASNGEGCDSSSAMSPSPTTVYYMAPPASAYTTQFVQHAGPSSSHSLPLPKAAEPRAVVDALPHHSLHHSHPSLYVVYPPPPLPPPLPLPAQTSLNHQYSTPHHIYQSPPLYHHPYPTYQSYPPSYVPHHHPDLHQQPLMLQAGYTYQTYLGEHGGAK